MSDSTRLVREAAATVGLDIPSDRLPALAAAYEQILIEAEAMRIPVAPAPEQSSFDAAWSSKK